MIWLHAATLGAMVGAVVYTQSKWEAALISALATGLVVYVEVDVVGLFCH